MTVLPLTLKYCWINRFFSVYPNWTTFTLLYRYCEAKLDEVSKTLWAYSFFQNLSRPWILFFSNSMTFLCFSWLHEPWQWTTLSIITLRTKLCTYSRCVGNYWKAVICLRAVRRMKQANPASSMQKGKYLQCLNFAACRHQLPAAFCKQYLPETYMSNISMQSNWLAHRGILLFGTWDVSSWVKDMSATRVASCFPITLHCTQ